MAQEGYKLLFQQSLFHRTLDQEEEEAPLGNIPLCGMGFYWCKMCVRLDYYAQLWQLRDPMAFKFLASKLHTAALALPRPQLFLSSSRSQIKAYQMQQEEERGEMQFATAFYCCLGVFRQSFGLAAAFAFCTLSLAPSTLFSLQSQLLYQLASPPGLAFAKTLSLSVSLPKKEFKTRIVNTLQFTCLATASNTAKINDFTVSKKLNFHCCS